jgi:hypothetical protein
VRTSFWLLARLLGWIALIWLVLVVLVPTPALEEF